MCLSLAHLGRNSQLPMLQEKGGLPARPGGETAACRQAEGLRGLQAGNLWDTDQRWLLWSLSILREKDLELGVSDFKTP